MHSLEWHMWMSQTEVERSCVWNFTNSVGQKNSPSDWRSTRREDWRNHSFRFYLVRVWAHAFTCRYETIIFAYWECFYGSVTGDLSLAKVVVYNLKCVCLSWCKRWKMCVGKHMHVCIGALLPMNKEGSQPLMTSYSFFYCRLETHWNIWLVVMSRCAHIYTLFQPLNWIHVLLHAILKWQTPDRDLRAGISVNKKQNMAQ